jgi:hypothetical protein
MTCLFMEGFEAVVDNLDMAARGWRLGELPAYSNQNVMTVPSRTGNPGRGLMLRGPYYSTSLTYLPFSGDLDFGMLDVSILPGGKSIYSLWQAGGFAVGYNATFNKGTEIQVAPNQSQQIQWDGVQYYWAIMVVGAGYVLGYSPDLINWTQCQASPAMGLNAILSVTNIGGVVTLLVSWHNSVTAYTSYYSTNNGVTWNPLTAAGVNTRGTSFTGNAAVPAIGMTSVSGTGFRLSYYSAPLSATAPTTLSAAPVLAPATNYANAFTKLVGSVFCAVSVVPSSSAYQPQTGTSYIATCLNTVDMTNAANWLVGPTCALGEFNDITFFNNQWFACGYGGISVAPQSGTPSAILGPASTSAWSTVLATAGVAVWSLATNGTVLLAVGQDPVNTNIGAIWTSPDGVTWTKQNRFMFASTVAQNGNNWCSALWDGSRFIITGGMNNNVIAVSTDGVAWTGLYYPDYPETAGTACASPLGIFSGIVQPGQFVGSGGNAGAGNFSAWTTSASFTSGWGFQGGVLSGSVRPVQVTQVQGGSTTVTVNGVATYNVSVANSLSHYYEIIATAVPATTNQFTIQFAIDGVVQPYTSAALYFASSTDTTGTAHLLLNLPRTGNWTVIDDIYVTSFAGPNNVGQLGQVTVLPITAAGDVGTDGFTRASGASNAAAVATPLSNSEITVSAAAVGAKDTYSTSSSLPVGYRVRAVQAEAYFSKFGASGANASVGIVSGATELDSTAVAALTATPAYATVLSETDPNTGVAWTAAGVTALELAITKTT